MWNSGVLTKSFQAYYQRHPKLDLGSPTDFSK